MRLQPASGPSWARSESYGSPDGGRRGHRPIERSSRVHPDFAINRYIYLYYSDGAGVNKVTRFVLGADGCSSPFDVLSNLGTSASGARTA